MSARDRHHRGFRGMLAPPRSPAGPRLRAQRPSLASRYFVDCVATTIDDIAEHCPEALPHVDIGIEEVPDVADLWSPHVPLATARDAGPNHAAQIVVYRRPIEFRCSDRHQIQQLVFTTVVEQLSQVTGISIDRIDPEHHRTDD
ncbi:MAG: metallopeptidase family protein [Propionibacteriaceae bacterium]|jgi:predicted Zn-dependent protease with MMP-like domain|nr:metallopeptidase family protein [Propionibacteriaceae bacterium]